jgi:hypothetical protein
MDDLSAELRLREIEPPYDEVKAERKALVEEIVREAPDNPGVSAKIEKFFEDRRKSKS